MLGGYDKTEAGTGRNEPEKLAAVIFLETAVRKFWKIVRAGLLYMLLSLPWTVAVYCGVYFIAGASIAEITEGLNDTQAALMSSMICSTAALCVVILWGSGPLSAAFSFVFRAFTKEIPIWAVSDGAAAAKENLRQGFIVMLTDAAVLAVSVIAIQFYGNLISAMPEMNAIFSILRWFLIIMLLIYTMMHPYIYQLMITFDSPMREIYKNALFLTLAKLPLNMIFMLIGAATVIVPIWVFSIYPIAAAIALALFGFFVNRFPAEFYAVRTIDREMIKKNSKEFAEELEYEKT